MDYILQRNDGNIAPTDTNGLHPLRVNIPISGAAIGNGWIDPYHQYAAAGAAYGAGIVGSAQRAFFDDKERECQSNLKSGNYYSGVCFDLLDDIVDQSSGVNANTKVSQYDTRLWERKGQPRSFPFGHKEVETYLGGASSSANPPLEVNSRDVLDAIHAAEAIQAGQTYRECTDPPYVALQHQDGKLHRFYTIITLTRIESVKDHSLRQLCISYKCLLCHTYVRLHRCHILYHPN